jgi:multidrug transporter EmrE-like cation transporter
MLKWRTLIYGLGFGLLDSIALPIVKSVSSGLMGKLWMLVPVILYGLSPFVFLNALTSETLTIMNLVWDLTSDVVVTLIGIFIFAEKLSPVKMLGVLFSFLSLFLMTYEGDGWSEFLNHNYARMRDAFTTR